MQWTEDGELLSASRMLTVSICSDNLNAVPLTLVEIDRKSDVYSHVDVMDMLAGKTLIKADGSEHPVEEVLRDVKLVALYFSAHWCPPCRHFTPILADAYAEVKESLPCAQVIFVSLDHSKEDMMNYMEDCHGDWYAIPYEDPCRE
ncbi:hypothetical protein HPB50_022258 [Hyalomma asiaticum]|uniref:Uncharacterized protein n=1 Tax=Hyalomma asiaticum TaxID=266040 RepID=A0ACB7T2C8_HYAAI|nr:hypothetical protein HPB50_022258 [Hyalomma asiaticum]